MKLRSILLTFCSFLALSAVAQTDYVQKVATFNFHTPSYLSTPMAKGDVLNEVTLSPKQRPAIVLDSLDVSLTVCRTPGYWVQVTNIKPNWLGLTVPKHAGVIISCSDDCELLHVDMRSMGFFDGLGGFQITEGTISFGDWDAAGTTGLRSLTFMNEGQDIVFSGVKVTYKSPADLLQYETVSPTDGEETDPFGGYTFTFADKVTVPEGVAFKVYDADDQEVATLSPEISGYQVKLTPADSIREPGNYKLKVPRCAFKTAIGEYNKAFELAFSVKDHPSSFNYTDINVKPGRVHYLPEQIVLTFPKAILENGIDFNELAFTFQPATPVAEGEEQEIQPIMAQAVVSEDMHQLILKFDNEIDEPGVYACEIPENSIHCVDGQHYNRAYSLSYNVVGRDVPTPEEIEKAQQLFELVGIGCPRSTSKARKQLAHVLEEMEDPALHELVSAVNIFVNSDDIAWPAPGRVYTFAKMSDDGKDVVGYLTCTEGDDESAFSLTDTATEFKVVYVEGRACLETESGQQYRVDFAKPAVTSVEALGMITLVIQDFTDESEGLGYVTTPVGGSSDEDTYVESIEEEQARSGKFIENGRLVIIKNGKKYNALGVAL